MKKEKQFFTKTVEIITEEVKCVKCGRITKFPFLKGEKLSEGIKKLFSPCCRCTGKKFKEGDTIHL